MGMGATRYPVVLAVLLWAEAATASERLPLVALDGPGVRRLCDVLRPDSQVEFPGNEVQRGRARLEHRRRRAAALERYYSASVPTPGFSFREYEAGEQHLAIEVRRPFALGDNVELGLPVTEDEPELVATVAPPAAEAIARLRQKGKLALRLGFKLEAQGQGEDVCVRGTARRIKLRIDPLFFELVEGARSRYRGELPAYAEALRATVPVVGPRVKVERPSVSAGEPSRELMTALVALEAGLLPCYQHGLESNARLRGALVVGFSVDGAGKVGGARSEINSLGDEHVAACVLERLKVRRFPKAARSFGRISVPIYFSAADD